MKTHMSNTEAFKLKNDIVGHQQFLNHQKALHSNVKPAIDNKRKSEVKIVKNNKVKLNTNPNQHVNKLYSNIFKKGYKSTLDNKAQNYDQMKGLLADKIKKNKFQKYAESQHQREVRCMKERIQNCKNLQQRKKDKTDPIVNPTYFIKEGKDVTSVTIEGYCKKILGMNRPQSGFTGTKGKFQQGFSTMTGKKEEEMKGPQAQLFGKLPNYAKQRPKSANMRGRGSEMGREDDLPGCTFKEILNHIVDHKLFRDVEMKVLYVRLCHKYGQENVQQLWQDLMDQLQR